jgi:hypothetical protein
MQIRLLLDNAPLDASSCKEVFGAVGHHLEPLDKAIDKTTLEVAITKRPCGATSYRCRLVATFVDGRMMTVERNGAGLLKTAEAAAKRMGALGGRLANAHVEELLCVHRLPTGA